MLRESGKSPTQDRVKVFDGWWRQMKEAGSLLPLRGEPFDNRDARDKDPDCTCGTNGLELDFKACEPLEPGETWTVIDAECVQVCTTTRGVFAELIAWALNRMDNGRDEVCRIHTKEWWERRAARFDAGGLPR